MSIKARIGIGKIPGEDEDEMTILHEGGKVICIEGESLWVVLRLSNGSHQSSGNVKEGSIKDVFCLEPKHIRINSGDISVDGKYGQTSQAPTFAYKKWSLQNQDLMVDVISCGT